ncbi:response regulator [Alkalihalobacillus alcalophilus]|uniref:response regulator transcription factor n=1 Tax=Alkalihalobacillus alcalophilus TaxID=1445 RepID=UPI00399D0415
MITLKANELCTVVIVDDEILIREGIKHYLDWEQEGFQIVGEASNGREALKIIEETKPHIVMTDIVMPLMDGEELTKEIKAQYPDIEVIILSSFGEFDYVRSTFQSGVVDYILKPNLDTEGLLKVLNRANERIILNHHSTNDSPKNNSIWNIVEKTIKGYEVNLDEPVITETFPYNTFYLLGINTKRASHQEECDENILTDFNLDSVVQLPYYDQKTNLEVVILNFCKTDEEKVKNKLLQNTQRITEVGLVLTESFSTFSDIGIYIEEIRLLQEYHFYFPNITLLQKLDLPKQTPSIAAFNLDQFTEDFTQQRFDSAIQYVRDYAKVFSTCYTTKVSEYKSFFSNIIFNISILLRNMDYDVTELEKVKYESLQFVEESNTTSKVDEYLNKFLMECYHCITIKRNQTGNPNMRKLLAYIQKHYAESLTLTGVANHFHFNPSYLSNYFSVHNKEGFVDYLNKIRIEEATKLLIQSDHSISEIGPMVGYTDHSYFSKMFKKLKGMSPSAYRRKFVE